MRDDAERVRDTQESHTNKDGDVVTYEDLQNVF